MQSFNIFRTKQVVTFLLIVYVLVSCQKHNAEDYRGNLNLSFKFNDKLYNIVNDTQCGCAFTGRPAIYAYYPPDITIRNASGEAVYQKYGREIYLVNYPLPEGNYSIRYKADLIETTACDSVSDIWKVVDNTMVKQYCINKNKYNYRPIDTTEYFTVKRKVLSIVERSF